MAIDFDDPLYRHLAGSLDAQLKPGTFGVTGVKPAGGSFDEEVRSRLKAMRAGAVPSVSSAPVAPAAPPAAAGGTSFGARALGAVRAAGRFLGGPLVGGAILAGTPTDAGAGSDIITDAATGRPLPRGGAQLTPEIVARTGVPTTGAALTPSQVQSLEFAREDAADAKVRGLQEQTAARTARVNEVIAASQAARGADAVTAEREASPVFPRGPSSYGDAFRFLIDLGRYKAAVKDQNEAITERRLQESARSKLLTERAKVGVKQIPIETTTGKGAVVGDVYIRPDPKDPSKLLTSKVPAATEDRLRPGLDAAMVKAEALAAAKKDPSKKDGINAALRANGYEPI